LSYGNKKSIYNNELSCDLTLQRCELYTD